MLAPTGPGDVDLADAPHAILARHRFGDGQYRYFAYPLPNVVGELRSAFWPHLLPVAREWAERRGEVAPRPDDLDEWLEQCHAAGQWRPTALMLRYVPGDWNALHRDLYGDLVFPLQVVVGLDRPAWSIGPLAGTASSTAARTARWSVTSRGMAVD